MKLGWLIGLLVIVAVLLFFLRKKPQEKSRAHKNAAATRSLQKVVGNAPNGEAKQEYDPFKGNRIQLGAQACTAVLAEADKTFAADGGPRLPLSNCDAAQCECRYVQVHGRRRMRRRLANDRRDAVRLDEDRREGEDRRSDVETWKNTR